MLGLGFSEIIFIAILALVVIGPKQLPEVARTLGRFINELRRSTSVFSDELKSQVRMDPFDLNSPPIPKPKPPVKKGADFAEPDAYTTQTSAQPELPVQPDAPASTAGDEPKNKA